MRTAATFVRFLVLSICVLLPRLTAAETGDRVDHRAEELALPDEYLDPAWPDDGDPKRIRPEESDNVDEAPLAAEQRGDAAPVRDQPLDGTWSRDEPLDGSEDLDAREPATERGNTNEALDARKDLKEPDDDPASETPDPLGRDDEEARDPAQW